MLLELDILWLTVQTGVVFTTSLIHVTLSKSTMQYLGHSQY